MPISIQHAHFSAKKQFELDCHNINVERGNCLAIVGVNGAGKTSLVETILGIKPGAHCQGSVAGVDVEKLANNKALLRRIGFQMQGMAFPFGVKIKEICNLHKLLYRRGNPDLLELLEIPRLFNKKYARCSLGEKMRIELYFACAHDPDILVFDEPTRGLDQLAKKRFIEWLKNHYFNKADKICLMTTHSDQDLKLATMLGWMKGGRLAFFGKKADFEQRYLGEFRLDVSAARFEKLTPLDKMDSAFSQKIGTSTTRTYYGDSQLKQTASSLLENNYDIDSASVCRTGQGDILDFITRN